MFVDNKLCTSNNVVITDYLTDCHQNGHERHAEEYNTIAVSPNDHRWYRFVSIEFIHEIF
jgi:hypothetical protein